MTETTPTKSKRIAAIDWARGFVMILMMIDHVSMAFNGNHFSSDSAGTFKGVLPDAFEFFTRWMTHLCAPTFVFLAGTALAISVERKISRGADASKIDREIFTRGLFIALLDPTLVSLFSWRMTFQVLYTIGAGMMCMVLLRRLSTKLLLGVALGWIVFGEFLVRMLWDPTAGNPAIPTALTMAFYYEPFFRVSYPLLPWLAIMCLGWAFGRYINAQAAGTSKLPTPIPLSILLGTLGHAVFSVVRGLNGYGNMMLTIPVDGWESFLFVSKYPPSLSFTAQQLGIFFWMLAIMMMIEKKIGVRPNGIMLVFGQTAMLFYLIHRVVLEGLAQWGGLRGFSGLRATYLIALVFLVVLYLICRWYRGYKREHPGGWTRFI